MYNYLYDITWSIYEDRIIRMEFDSPIRLCVCIPTANVGWQMRIAGCVKFWQKCWESGSNICGCNNVKTTWGSDVEHTERFQAWFSFSRKNWEQY